MNLPDDRALLLRLKAGDKESFRTIYDRHAPQFLAFARRLLRDADAAEDVVQNVFMRLWIARERIDEERNLRNYLTVSVRNEIYCHLRAAFHARRVSTPAGLTEIADSAPAPDHQLAALDMEQAVGRIVEDMPTRRREIFTLSRQQHLSNAEIAHELGISVRTVEKHIELALSDIRGCLPITALWIVTTLW